MWVVSTNILKWGWVGELIGNLIAAHPNIFSSRVFARIKEARYQSYQHVPNFKVIPWPLVTAQAIYKINSRGGATLRLGWSQDHPNLNFIF